MSAYVVFLQKSVHDPEGFAEYGKVARAARGDHNITNLAAYGDLTVLEGEPVEGIFIHRFDDVAAAKAWYHSPAYQEAVALRQAAADYQVFIVEGSDV